MNCTKPKTVEEYLSNLNPTRRIQFDRINRIVKKIAGTNSITQSISYGIVVFKYQNKPLIYFGSFQKHMSLYPPTTKFTEDKPLTDKQITTIVNSLLFRLKSNLF